MHHHVVLFFLKSNYILILFEVCALVEPFCLLGPFHIVFFYSNIALCPC